MEVRSSSYCANEKLWSEEPDAAWSGGAGGAASSGGAGGAPSTAGPSRQAPSSGTEGAGGADAGPPLESAGLLGDHCVAELVAAALTCRDAVLQKRPEKVISCAIAADAAVACLVDRFKQ